jgi:hypothetical protein
MSNRASSLRRYAVALICAAWVAGGVPVPCGAAEPTPEDWAEWGRRRDGVKEAAEKAEEGEVAPLLQWLVLELADPLPADLPVYHTDYTLSEIVRASCYQPLTQMPDPASALGAYAVAVELEKYLIIALGLRGMVSLDEEKPQQEVLKRCIALLKEDPSDFVRAQAARALGEIGLKHRDLVPQLEPVLREALKDPAHRPGRLRTEMKTWYPVRETAWSALSQLGFDLGPVDSWAYSD